MTRRDREQDLFGFDNPKEPDGKGMVALALVDFPVRETPKAWLLSKTDDPKDAQWVAKSLARRGEGPDANVWTMPTWKARELGWL